jgi:hypothetical protein
MRFGFRRPTALHICTVFLLNILTAHRTFSQADPAVGNESQITFTKSSTGFYFPTGVPDTQYPKLGGTWLGRDAKNDWDGPPSYNDDRYHIGFDIKADYGAPVFAAAAGRVVYRSTNWNNDGTTNNVGIGILHTLNDGSQFVAFYGHIHSGLQIGDVVTGGVQIGTVGHWLNGSVYVDHLHFGIKPGYDYLAGLVSPNLGFMENTFWPNGVTAGQINANPAAYTNITNGFVDPIAWIKSHTPACQNGSSQRYMPGGQIPIHPDGSIVKVKTNDAAYVLRGGQRLLIPDRQTLNTLYGFGRGFDFQDIVTVSPQELSQYEDGGVVRSALPSNGRNEPDGRLIRQWGGIEISLVTKYNGQDGFRMPFATGSAFLNLGYAECNVAGVSDYNSGYPTPPSGLTIENMSRGVQASGIFDPNFSTSASASPSSPSPGQSTMISLAVTNNGGTANDRIVDAEIFDSAGSRVFQQLFEHQFFTLDVPVSSNFNWIPGAAGTYVLKVGIFSADWSSLDTWNNAALSINVGGVAPPPSTYQIDIWWPTQGAQVSGAQPFKALISGVSTSTYVMYWQVDGGQLNVMNDSTVDAPHKEAVVDLTGWTWRGSGPYTVNFIAKDLNGNLLAQRSVSITVMQ